MNKNLPLKIDGTKIYFDEKEITLEQFKQIIDLLFADDKPGLNKYIRDRNL